MTNEFETLRFIYNLRDAVNPDDLNTAIVISLGHLGDVLLSTPVFSTLKAHNRGIKTIALVYEDCMPMVENNAFVDKVISLKKSSKQSPLDRIKSSYDLFKRLKKESPDLIVHLSSHWRGALLSAFTKPKVSVAGEYASRQNALWKYSFSHHYPLHPNRSRIESNLDALRRIGLQPTSGTRSPSLVIPPEEKGWAKNIISGFKKPGKIVHIHPTSRWMFKCYPAEKLAVVIGNLINQGCNIVLSSGPDKKERLYIKEISDGLSGERLIDMCGQTTLTQLSALIDSADLFLGVDTVAMHIANTLGVRNISLFGPSNDKVWGWKSSEVITSLMPCRPCESDGCGGGKVSECLHTLSPSLIADRTIELIRQSKPNDN